MEERIKNLMKVLECTREEALEIIADDEAIDKGEKLFELSAEQKKASKQARQSSRKVTEKKAKRERKVDTDKQTLFKILIDTFGEIGDNLEIINQDRELEFKFNERKFKIVLSAPRKQGLDLCGITRFNPRTDPLHRTKALK